MQYRMIVTDTNQHRHVSVPVTDHEKDKMIDRLLNEEATSIVFNKSSLNEVFLTMRHVVSINFEAV